MSEINDKSITSEVVVAYSQCPLKAYLLLFSDDKGTPHDYIRILEDKQLTNRHRYIEAFRQKHIEAEAYSIAHLKKSNLLIEARLQSKNLNAYCDILTNVESNSGSYDITYEPTLVVGTCSISEEQKTELQYVGTVLGRLQKKTPLIGTIVGVDGKAHKLKLESGYKTIKAILKTLEDWVVDKPTKPPPVILNKYCQTCQFRNSCRVQAEKENHLSLLERITLKAIQRYNKRGIFTIQQLSYLYKPRRRKGKDKNLPIKHKVELQALAIRENKIYIQELPQLLKSSVEIFLDIEGIPDQNFHYLIGLIIYQNGNIASYSFWAELPSDEEKIYAQMIAKINEYPEAIIYHYGSYEPKAIKNLTKKYSISSEDLNKRLININSCIYGKIYFPTLSNSLKDIGNFIGHFWQYPNVSGLQAITWRYLWEESYDPAYKEMLLAYNLDDCKALKALTSELYKIQETAGSSPKIDFADKPKRFSTEKGQQAHEQFETIIKFAHADYDKNKISLQQVGIQEETNPQKEV